jgi:hypothetical protein
MTARQSLILARRHLKRVQAAWDPPDWLDLAVYGFYCLENAVSAAATHAKLKFAKTHPSKAEAARQLAARHGLPDVSSLLVRLNDARKSVAYGDITMPNLDPQDVAIEIAEYVDAVEAFLGR